uniref:Spore germination protein n=1 Tax=Steinernema glaseri TaxID=37863 RepID=A0A1I7Z4J7_9BILA
MLQSITPVLTSSLPSVAMIIGILLEFEGVRMITWSLSATFVWLPTLNAVISLVFIAPLRSLFQKKKEHQISFKVISLMSYKKP